MQVSVTRTNLILRAVTAALERRSAYLDAEPGLRSVTLEVQIHRDTGDVRDVIFRPESAGGALGNGGERFDAGGPGERRR